MDLTAVNITSWAPQADEKLFDEISKLYVIAVEWDKPLYIPIPVSKDVIYKLSYPMTLEYSNIIIATRWKNIVNSRLEVTALTNNNRMLLNFSITLTKNRT